MSHKRVARSHKQDLGLEVAFFSAKVVNYNGVAADPLLCEGRLASPMQDISSNRVPKKGVDKVALHVLDIIQVRQHSHEGPVLHRRGFQHGDGVA